MDPDTALAAMDDERAPLADRAEHAAALLEWLDRGGFVPAAITSARELEHMTARARRLVSLAAQRADELAD